MSVMAKRLFRAPDQQLRDGRRARFAYKGFTLIELLVVIAIIAILASIMFPVFASAKEAGKKAKCAAQLKQLVAASIAYADDYGRYVPAARDINSYSPTGGNWRWHGYRPTGDSEFDPKRGPLWIYMSRSGGIKKCPCAQSLQTLAVNQQAFESGGGGYGYNQFYVGGTYYRNSSPEAAEIASTPGDIAQPSKTVMFADTALPKVSSSKSSMIEYSFAEPPYRPDAATSGAVTLTRTASPTIHFRHTGYATVGWCDGHVSCAKLSFSKAGTYTRSIDSARFGVGWFGTDDNSLFDNR